MQRIRHPQFSLANIMLMMVPLAAACSVIGYALSKRWDVSGIAALAVAVGVPAAIGALFAGRNGLWNGFGIGFRIVYIALFFMLLYLLLFVRVH